MALIDRFFNRAPIVEAPQQKSIFQAIRGDVGVVNSDTAMQHSVVFSCVQIIADAMASVPLNLIERSGSNNILAKSHSLYRVLKYRPNPNMTSFEWRQMAFMDALQRGNHYSQIIRNGVGDVVGLYPLIADNMEVALRVNGQKVYIYRPSKGPKILLKSNEVFHFKGLPDKSGLVGLNPIEYNRKAIKLSMTTEQFGINFFENGANGSGVLKTPKVLSDEAYERLRKSFEEKYQGLANSGRPIILEDGLEYVRLSLSNEDSQYLATRGFQKAEIASIFKVPLYMLNDMSKATFNNMEQMGINFVINTLNPWAVRFEQAVTNYLLRENEWDRYYAKFKFNSLMRGDHKSRSEYYRTLINSGVMTPNEARKLEDMDPMGSEADELYMQTNMGTLKGIANANQN